MNIYCDGSWNGKIARVLVCNDDGVIMERVVGKASTSNEAEYHALLLAIDEFAECGDVIHSDSQLIVNQVTGGWKIKKRSLFSLAMQAKKRLAEVGASLVWVPREDNFAGHLLEGNG